MKEIGFLLFIIGFGLTIFTAAKFFTQEKIVSLGALEITAQKPHYLSWSPILGIVIMVIGVFFIFKFKKKI